MKLLVLLICSFAFNSTNGQEFSGKISNIRINKDIILGTPKPLLNALAINETKYKFLFKNEKGKVYESPVDHMRCLAPDFRSHMPVVQLRNETIEKPVPIPNPFLKNSTIPKPLPENKQSESSK